MTNRIKSALSGGGFYAVLALCVLAAGVGGYFLLFDREAAPVEEPPAAAAPAVETEAPPVVETVKPQPVVEPEPEPEPMPETEIDDTPVVAEAPHLVVSPLQGEVVAAFSVDELVYNETLEDWRTHAGVDISAAAGTTVMAACSGTVAVVENDPLMGTTVSIDHSGGYRTTYANLQAKPAVEIGDRVTAGQIIGAVGATAAAESAQGPHLHFSVTQDGDAVDPEEFLSK